MVQVDKITRATWSTRDCPCGPSASDVTEGVLTPLNEGQSIFFSFITDLHKAPTDKKEPDISNLPRILASDITTTHSTLHHTTTTYNNLQHPTIKTAHQLQQDHIHTYIYRMARRKIATSDILTDIPELEEGQRFARVLGTRGKNVHEVQFSDNQELLVNLPPKFRSLVWVKRG